MKKRDALDDLDPFTSFYKKRAADDSGTFKPDSLDPNLMKRNAALEDLLGNSFASFQNGWGRKKRRPSFDMSQLRDVLGTFSSFMDPNRYKRPNMD